MVTLISFCLYCVALVFSIRTKYEGLGRSGEFNSSVFMGAVSACYFFFGGWVLCGRLLFSAGRDEGGREEGRVD